MGKILSKIMAVTCIDKATGLVSIPKLFGLSLAGVVVFLVGLDGTVAILRNTPPVVIPFLKDYVTVIFTAAVAFVYGVGRDIGYTIAQAAIISKQG